MTLDGHEPDVVISSPDGGYRDYNSISCISYLPDGKQMISGSRDKTIRRWDLQEGKEIEEAREVLGNSLEAVEVSRDGRWVVTAGWEVKVSEVETGIVRTFHEGDEWIICIDISVDSTLLAVASFHCQAWIWRLDTGELVAGPLRFGFTFDEEVLRVSEDFRKLAVVSNWGRIRLSEDCRKLAVLLNHGRCLQMWNVQTQKLDVQKFNSDLSRVSTPIFWTTKHKSIATAFNLTTDATIHEIDALTLETVGPPFKGHTHCICGLALSSDRVLLVSSSFDNTIKLWAFESRQLLASFDVESPVMMMLVLSSDSRQLAYTNRDNRNIYICNIPVNILASIGLAEEPQSRVCIPP